MNNLPKIPLVAHGCRNLRGTTTVPGDKSISHRALMLATLADGHSTIQGLLEGDDVLCTAAAMSQLGARIKIDAQKMWQVRGVGVGKLQQPERVLNMGNSGTACRLLIGLVATHPLKCQFDGDASLRKRPMARVLDPLVSMGGTFFSREHGRLPLAVYGADRGASIDYTLPVASAQVKSALLLAALNTEGTTLIHEPTPTRDHTENMLQQAGVKLQREQVGQGYTLRITGPAKLTPQHFVVPADPSSAAFPLVAALLTPDSHITITGVCTNPRRTGVYRTLEKMGATLSFNNPRTSNGEPVADILAKTSVLRGVTIDDADVPDMIDEILILGIAAACAQGTTRFAGLAELRVKESDRLGLLAKNLAACGVDVQQEGDDLVIHGTGSPPRGGAMVETHMDHRIAMSFLVLGGVTPEPVMIDDSTFIGTSFPGFQSLMNSLGANIQAYAHN
ncbi:MAG: 3-phosphoshikimate 1-carboxyvinyltransferase [Alphaproteobacteria bacterium]|nr:3-phosphoshikimate 1-carboxyvinyltransferase [Alphaproteobacteria bacterium]